MFSLEPFYAQEEYTADMSTSFDTSDADEEEQMIENMSPLKKPLFAKSNVNVSGIGEGLNSIRLLRTKHGINDMSSLALLNRRSPRIREEAVPAVKKQTLSPSNQIQHSPAHLAQYFANSEEDEEGEEEAEEEVEEELSESYASVVADDPSQYIDNYLDLHDVDVPDPTEPVERDQAVDHKSRQSFMHSLIPKLPLLSPRRRSLRPVQLEAPPSPAADLPHSRTQELRAEVQSLTEQVSEMVKSLDLSIDGVLSLKTQLLKDQIETLKQFVEAKREKERIKKLNSGLLLSRSLIRENPVTDGDAQENQMPSHVVYLVLRMFNREHFPEAVCKQWQNCAQEFNRAKGRVDVLTEIINTERDYLASLNNFHVDWKQELINGGVLAQTKADQFFAPFQKLAQTHTDLLSQLEALIEFWTPESSALSRLFCELVPKISSTYIEFCNSYSTSRNSCEKILRKRTMKALMQQLKEHPLRTKVKTLRFDSYMIQPIQRIPRYMLLLKSFLKATPKGHAEIVPLQRAIGLVHQMTNLMNDGIYGVDDVTPTATTNADEHPPSIVQPSSSPVISSPVATHTSPPPQLRSPRADQQLLMLSFSVSDANQKRISMVPASVHQLNQQSCFVVDAYKIVYVWIGVSSSVLSRTHAKWYASQLGLPVTVLKCNTDCPQFYKMLRGDSTQVSTTPRDAGSLTQGHTASRVFVVNQSGSIDETSSDMADLLESAGPECIIIAAPHIVFVWTGAESSQETRKQAMCHAMQLSTEGQQREESNIHLSKNVELVMQGDESLKFTALYLDDMEKWCGNISAEQIEMQQELKRRLKQQNKLGIGIRNPFKGTTASPGSPGRFHNKRSHLAARRGSGGFLSKTARSMSFGSSLDQFVPPAKKPEAAPSVTICSRCHEQGSAGPNRGECEFIEDDFEPMRCVTCFHAKFEHHRAATQTPSPRAEEKPLRLTPRQRRRARSQSSNRNSRDSSSSSASSMTLPI